MVKDQNAPIGTVALHLPTLLKGDTSRVWWPIACPSPNARLSLSTRYVSNADLQSPECPHQAFPLRAGCRMTLYADARVSRTHPPPPIALGGVEYKAQDCWADMYASMSGATKFIFLAGFSMWTELRMLRPGPTETLGELLTRKAKEGLCVRVMIWDDSTSVDSVVLNTVSKTTQTGVMGTHDDETYNYFKKTGVACVKVKNKALGYHTSRHMGTVRRSTAASAHLSRNASFSHHEKILLCDAASVTGTPKRRIVAYVGGIDLTDGRYDDATHPLFSTLETTHKGDFYQRGLATADPRAGPRQAWHDVHCRLEGPVARDVLKHYAERWHKQVQYNMRFRVPKRNRHYRIETDFGVLSSNEDIVPGPQKWSLQFFRSIDCHSSAAVPSLEDGCHNAYIFAIRRAQRFIYLENQYFMGSSTVWENFDDKRNNVECKHHIPMEIAMRIVTKIRQHQPFAVYMVIPLHPEGDVASVSVQGMLHFQTETIRMMYRKVAAALKRWGPPGAHPHDYLNIFFLGKRELDLPAGASGVRVTARQAQLLRSRRHMIYVHSKLAIFDDDYVLVGSANINQRSMDGARDTEVLVGGLEGGVLRDPTTGLPGGQVAAFRLQLWAEHMGGMDPEFEGPHTPSCVAHVRQRALENWAVYVSPTVAALPFGHLCRYPYDIDADGKVTPTIPNFPDHDGVTATILGSPPPVLLQFLLT